MKPQRQNHSATPAQESAAESAYATLSTRIPQLTYFSSQVGMTGHAICVYVPGICYSIFKFLPSSDTQTPVGFRGSSLIFVLSRKFVVLLIQIRHIDFFGRVLLLVLVRCLRFISRINSVSGTYLTPFRCHVG